MAITFDAATGFTSTNFSHTATGTNLIALLAGGNEATSAKGITSVTYGGQAMTELWTGLEPTASRLRLDLYYLINPPTGNQTISISDSNGEMSGVLMTYAGVDVNDPFVESVATDVYSSSQYANNPATMNHTITHGAQQLVYCFGFTDHTSSVAVPMVLDTNINQRATSEQATTFTYAIGGDANKAPSGTFTNTVNTAANRPKWFIAGTLKPASTGISRAIKYFHDINDPEGRIFDELGRVVPPWELKPDNWIRVTGLFLPFGTKYESFTQDPELAYIEEVSFSARRGLRIKTNRGELTEVLMARAAGGKTL